VKEREKERGWGEGEREGGRKWGILMIIEGT
jgi:hypothetical protein